MNLPDVKITPQIAIMVAGLVTLGLLVFWGLKIRSIQQIKADIVQMETKLSKGQEIWKGSPPLTPKEKEDLKKSQERLFRMLPKEKDVPSLLQEVSRVARQYDISNLSLSTGDEAAPPAAGSSPAPAAVAPQVVSQPTTPILPNAPESSGNIDKFSVKLTFAGDYREIAYFLEALQKIPRITTIQSLQLQRSVPLVLAEIILHAYYQKGDASVK